MSGENSPGYEVATQSLRRTASIWDQAAETMSTIPAKTEEVRLNRLNAGVFQLIVSPYEAVVDTVAERSREGATQLHAIARELRSSADTYEKTENGNTGISQAAGH